MARLQRIHKELAGGRFPSVQWLAENLEVTTRTIKRDLATLRYSFAAPVEYDRKKKGFGYREPGWTLPVQRLSEGELLAFFLAERSLRSVGHSAEAILLKSALSKLSTLLPDEVLVDINQLAETVSFQRLPVSTVDPTSLAEIAKACVECQALRIEYFSPHSQKRTERTIEPYCIHNFAGDWYVIAFDHLRNAIRDFQVGRIQKLFALHRWFEKDPSWNSEAYLSKGFWMTRGGRLTTVEIIFDPYQAQWIRERDELHSSEIREELPDGSLRLVFKSGSAGMEAVARFCLGYSGHVRIVRPKQLISIVNSKAEKMLKDNSP
jgi:predicted DNA-binding transcriptional regulator YafY